MRPEKQDVACILSERPAGHAVIMHTHGKADLEVSQQAVGGHGAAGEEVARHPVVLPVVLPQAGNSSSALSKGLG